MNKQDKRGFDWRIVGGIAVIAFIIYLVIGAVTAFSGPIFGIFAKHSHPIRGLLDICSIIAFFPLIVFVFMLITGQLGGHFFSENTKIELLLFAVMIIGALNMPLAFGVGSTQIGSFFEKTVYTEEYYVEVNGTTCPATILRTHDRNDGRILYILEQIHFKNDSVYFTPPDVVDIMPSWEIDYIVPGVKTVVTTDEGQSFTVVLTTERVE